MSEPLEILKQYCNHQSFRTPQEEIIASVLAGQDTFGLMPTGGGKSITFQVPTLMKSGLCLVISPLIALMKDQVKNLQSKGIKALALTGGITQDELITLLDNCQFGNYKFLYLSPERLQNDWIVDRLKSLPIELIAVDEAHCVSQWGHDFRPAYLKIAKLKTIFPKVPMLALTASATKRVQEDIIAQLQLENPKVFTKSFARENLAYMVYAVEDKVHFAQKILKKHPEPAILYVTNRKACLETAKHLEAQGISATYYHGGLSGKDKDHNMTLWMEEKVQVMVATNAFGMGIDKANVKTVLHIHIPPNLENYYQEAGRAGRNGAKAYAVLLTNPSDEIHAESQFLNARCDTAFLKTVFIKLCNYFQIAFGEGIDETFSFNMLHFCTRYNFPTLKVFEALKFLDNQGIINLTKEFSEKTTLQFTIPSKELIRYMSLNPNDEPLLLAILRTNPGIYDHQTAINTALLAKKTNLDEDKIIEVLHQWHHKQIIELHAKSNDAKITFNEIREDDKTINRVAKYLESQNKLKEVQLQSVFEYIHNENQCRTSQILDYFGEAPSADCGICSYCIQTKTPKKDILSLTNDILSLLASEDLNSRTIEKRTNYPKEDVIFALQKLLESDRIFITATNLYSLKRH